MSTRLSRRKISQYVADQVVAGEDVKKLATSLAAFLIDSRRTNEVDLVVRDIEYQLSERGMVMAQVVSAHVLTAATVRAVTDMIKTSTHATSIDLSQQIDPSVLGGVRVDIPGRQFDGTIARRLHQLTTNDN